MAAAILLTMSRDQNRKILMNRIWFSFCTWKQSKLFTVYERNVYCPITYFILHLNGCYFMFCNSEGMTSFPHSLILDLQPHFELTLSECLNLYNFLINLPIFMKILAKC